MRLNSSLLSLCLLALTACGGGGGGGSTATSPSQPTSPPVLTGNTIFIGDSGNQKMAAIDTLTPTPGSLSAKVFTTNSSAWFDAAFDGTRNELYVAAFTQIDVYANARKLDGTITASRSIIPAINGYTSLRHVVLDKANDRLYIGFKAPGSGGVAVFEQASKLNGTVAPSRIFSGNIYHDNFTLDLKRNLLYTSWNFIAPAQVFVFEHIDSFNGEAPIARRIGMPGVVQRLSIDSSRDRLYMVTDNGGVIVLDGASTAAGRPAVTTFSLPTSNSGSAVTIDAANDRLYLGFTDQAFVLNDASKLTNSNGSAQAAAIKAPANTTIAYFALPQ